MTIIADPKDIERYKRSLWSLYLQEGRSIHAFINSIAESFAFQNAIRKSYLSLLKQEKIMTRNQILLAEDMLDKNNQE